MLFCQKSLLFNGTDKIAMIIAANWKMNLMHDEAQHLSLAFKELALKTPHTAVDIVIFPPALYAVLVNEVTDISGLSWGGQASHWQDQGAHTGDISAAMFASAGAKWQLAGHSERRTDHSESDDDIARQVQAGQKAGLHVMLCVGETLAQREAGKAIEIVTNQISRALADDVDFAKLAIAYEPVWAIGTGKVAAPEDVAEMHQAIATHLAVLRSGKEAGRPPILYGGSVKAANAAALFALPYVDGALVGGASLKISDFAPIVQAAQMLVDAK